MSPSENEFEFTRLWMKAQPTVAGFIAAMLGRSDYHTIDDLLQEVALALFENFSAYDRRKSFMAWAMGITKNKLRIRWRTLARSRVLYADQAVIEALERISVDRSVHLKRRQHAMQECAQYMDGRTWQIARMRYHDGLSPKTIAEKLKLSAGNVRVLLSRMRAALRACVERRLRAEQGAM